MKIGSDDLTIKKLDWLGYARVSRAIREGGAERLPDGNLKIDEVFFALAVVAILKENCPEGVWNPEDIAPVADDILEQSGFNRILATQTRPMSPPPAVGSVGGGAQEPSVPASGRIT